MAVRKQAKRAGEQQCCINVIRGMLRALVPSWRMQNKQESPEKMRKDSTKSVMGYSPPLPPPRGGDISTFGRSDCPLDSSTQEEGCDWLLQLYYRAMLFNGATYQKGAFCHLIFHLSFALADTIHLPGKYDIKMPTVLFRSQREKMIKGES